MNISVGVAIDGYIDIVNQRIFFLGDEVLLADQKEVCEVISQLVTRYNNENWDIDQTVENSSQQVSAVNHYQPMAECYPPQENSYNTDPHLDFDWETYL